MAAGGVPFQIAAERRYDRSGDPRPLRRALDEGAHRLLPQVHQVLPRLMRLIVALRVGAARSSKRRVLVSVRRRGARADGDGTSPRRAGGRVLAPARGAAHGHARRRRSRRERPGSAVHGRRPRGVAHARARPGEPLPPAPVDAARRRLPRPLAGALAHVGDGAGSRVTRDAPPRWRRGTSPPARSMRIPPVSRRATVDSGPGDRGPARHGGAVPPDDARRRRRPSGTAARRIGAGRDAVRSPVPDARRHAALRLASRARDRGAPGSSAADHPERPGQLDGWRFSDDAGAARRAAPVRASRRRGRCGDGGGGRHDANGGGGAPRPLPPRPLDGPVLGGSRRPSSPAGACWTGHADRLAARPARSRRAAPPRLPPAAPRTSRAAGVGAGGGGSRTRRPYRSGRSARAPETGGSRPAVGRRRFRIQQRDVPGAVDLQLADAAQARDAGAASRADD